MKNKKNFIYEEKIYSKNKGNLFDLYVSSDEEELQKVKSVQTESVFFMILVKLINRKYEFNLKEFHGEMSLKLCKYPSAVSGYHYYCHYWRPIVGELGRLQKRDNFFDLLAMVIKKTMGENFVCAKVSNGT